MALAAAVGAALVLVNYENDLFGSFSLPAFRLPEISMPELDLRGRAGDAPVNSPVAAVEVALAPFESSGAADPIIQSVPFENCLDAIGDAVPGFGPPALLEDTSDRRVARFKLLEGAITVTCSRRDGTMTIERGLR